MPETIGSDGRLKDRTGIAPQGVVVRAWLTANQTVTNATWTKVIYNLKEDAYGWWDLPTGRFTPKVPGYYNVSAGLLAGIGANQQVLVAIYRNGAVVRRLSQISNSRTSDVEVSGSCIVYLNGSTDYVEVFGYTDATPFRGDAPELTYVDISLVGTSIGVIPEPWHIVGATGEPGFQNGWAGYNNGLAFCKLPDNTVRVKGEAVAGTWTGGTTIFNLPAGYRPGWRYFLPVYMNSSPYAGFISVQTSGDVQVEIRAGTATHIHGFGSVSFRAEA